MKRLFTIAVILFYSTVAYPANLLFKSGFDTSTVVYQTTSPFNFWSITGVDATSGYNWVDDIVALDENRAWGPSDLYSIYGNYDNVWTTDSFAEIVADPDDAGNKVLHYKHVDGVYRANADCTALDDPYGCCTGSGTGDCDYWNSARLSGSLGYNQDSTTGFSEGYVKYRMRLSDLSVFESSTAKYDWFVLMEQVGYYSGSAEFSIYFSLLKDGGAGQSWSWFFVPCLVPLLVLSGPLLAGIYSIISL